MDIQEILASLRLLPLQGVIGIKGEQVKEMLRYIEELEESTQ